MNLRTGLIATALALSIVSHVHAGTLASGSFQADAFICHAVNVGASTISSVTVEIVNSGTGMVGSTHNCSNVAANHECLESFAPVNTEINFCRIITSGGANHIRSTFIGVQGTTVLVTEAR